MNYRLTFHVLGGLLLFLAAALLLPIPFAIYYADGQVSWFVLSAALTALCGGLLYRYNQSRDEVTLREGFAIVTFTWLSFAMFGSLPYLLCGWESMYHAETSATVVGLPHPVDAFFESMSGFTTSGASVLTDVEANPKSLLFWRALTQWIGGMGIIVLTVAILPMLGVGGMQLYEAESAGPTADRLTPRIQDTARVLWGAYALLTAAGAALLWAGEMNFYDAVCHSFTAIATGGFSTRNASMGAFGTYSQVVIIVLMFIGATSFSLHYFALRGQLKKYWSSDEFRFYWYLTLGAILVVFLFNLGRYQGDPLLNLRDTAFSVISVSSTCGFATADYEQWHIATQAILFTAMFVGGCAGSTAGGLKQVRLIILLKHALLQLVRLIHPRQVKVLKLDQRPVSSDIMQDILGFTVLFLGVFLVSTLLLNAVGVDLVTASSGTIACLSSVGPGLGEVGPLDNYAGLPTFAKVVLSLVMLLGRLEVSTVLVLFFRSFWKK